MVTSIRRYRDLDTDLDGLYGAIVKILQETKELNILHEYKGKVDEDKPFKSVIATLETVPRAFVGALREVTITITGTKNDFIVEIHTGSWLHNILVPGAGGFLIAGPIGSAAAASTTAIIAIEYHRKLIKKIRELVKIHSTKPLTIDQVENIT